MTTGAILVAAVLLAGLLAGNELATLMAFRPALRRLPLRARIEAEQALTRRRGAIMPVYLSAPLLAAIAAAAASAGRPGFGFALAAAAALGMPWRTVEMFTLKSGSARPTSACPATRSATAPSGTRRVAGVAAEPTVIMTAAADSAPEPPVLRVSAPAAGGPRREAHGPVRAPVGGG
ncbi:MAG TPA: hypothetical protein VG370_14975 [Chloroflexota bacterium]|nr:hypothetical protein [Chloroflexota bacterium]